MGKALTTCCNDMLLCATQSIHAWACSNTREMYTSMADHVEGMTARCVISTHASTTSSTATMTALSMPTHSTHQKARLQTAHRQILSEIHRQTDRQTDKQATNTLELLPGTTTTFSSFSLSRISSASLMPPHSLSQANMPA